MRSCVSQIVRGTGRQGSGWRNATLLAPDDCASLEVNLGYRTADEANVVRTGRHVGRDCQPEASLLDERRLQVGVIEEERLDPIEIGTGDFQLYRAAGGTAKRNETVEANGGKVGARGHGKENAE